jgi:protein-arginine kinase activator protein McsA
MQETVNRYRWGCIDSSRVKTIAEVAKTIIDIMVTEKEAGLLQVPPTPMEQKIWRKEAKKIVSLRDRLQSLVEQQEAEDPKDAIDKLADEVK